MDKDLRQATPRDRRRRLTDLSIIAPVAGFILLIPPVINLFAADGLIFGAPRSLVYIFAVWAGLVVVAALLSRALGRDESDEAPDR